MQLSILKEDDDAVRVSASGRITQENLIDGSEPLLDLLGPVAYSKKVLFNLRDAEFLDSSGISWFLVRHKRFQENGGQMVLYSIPQIVMNTIKVLRMHLVLQIAGSEQEALERASGS